MKFLITSGRKKGFTFEVTDEEVRIGRKKENDVVLDDESVSGYHARIGLKGDDVIVEDCDSVNGIELNGKPAKKSALSIGDVITIGMTQITVVPDEEEEEAEEKTKRSKADEDEEDEPEDQPAKAGRSSKDKEKGKKAGRPSNVGKTVAAIVLVVLVVGFACALPVLKKRMRSPSSAAATGPGSPTAFTQSIFRLRYEKVQASAKNIFRYEMCIENGTLNLAIDDLKQERHLHRNKALEPAAIGRIRSAIQDQQIFSLPSQIEGKSADMWDSSSLEVVMGGQTHRIRVLNRLPPDNFKKVCTQLEDFGEKELNVVGFSTLSSDELKKRAQDTYQRARQLSEQRSVKAENLFNAIKAFGETIWYLESLEPKPPLYADAIKARQEALDALNEQIKDHEFRATRAIQLREWKSAALELRQLLEKLPDQTDKRYQEAQVKLLDAERHLQSK